MLEFWKRVEKRLIDLEKPRTWLSDETEIEKSTVTTWVTQNRYPTIDKAQLLANVLGVSLDYLMTGEEPKFSDPDIQELCDISKILSREQIHMAKGVIQTLIYQRLTPQMPIAVMRDEERAASD